MDRAGWSYPPSNFRVSDADRDHALAELSTAFQVGRITADEFDQRSGQALAARTGNELTALLADLPTERVPAPRTSAVRESQRLLASRVAVAAGVAAICFAATAAVAALNTGPSLAQRELIRQMMASRGLPVPPGVPPSLGFDWAGVITPAAIAVLLVMLVVILRVRVARADRP
jgi:hypothetical protein